MQNENIQSLGGKARAEKLSAEELSAQASKAAMTRWANRPVRAIKGGTFKEHFGFDADCYVLDDVQKTAVISQTGMGRALGFSASGGMRFPRFLASEAMSSLVGPELGDKLSQPIKFQWGSGGPDGPPRTINGFDVTMLIDLCRLIVQANAEGRFGSRHQRAVVQAQVILAASAKAGIKGLVYA
ncbi:MAG: hypothetical protein WAK51_06610, partial [Opitutaceae bacterium]